MTYNQFSDEPILATLADLPEQENPYRSPKVKTESKPSNIATKVASSVSYALHYFFYAVLSIVGFLLSGFIVIPELWWIGCLGLLLGVIAFASLVVISRTKKLKAK